MICLFLSIFSKGYLRKKNDDKQKKGLIRFRFIDGLTLDQMGQFSQKSMLILVFFERAKNKGAKVTERFPTIVKHIYDSLRV